MRASAWISVAAGVSLVLAGWWFLAYGLDRRLVLAVLWWLVILFGAWFDGGK